MQRSEYDCRLPFSAVLTSFLQVIEQYFFAHEPFSMNRHVFFTSVILVQTLSAVTSNQCASVMAGHKKGLADGGESQGEDGFDRGGMGERRDWFGFGCF